MILRRYIHDWVIQAFVVILCFENWIYCAPSSVVKDDDLVGLVDVASNSQSREPAARFTNRKAVRRIRRPVTKPVDSTQPDNAPDSQSFLQSFAPFFTNNSPVQHSRPLLYPDHSFKPSFKTASFRDLPFTGTNDNILGSGNFGVVKGGTYYAEERDDGADFASDSEPYAYIGNSPARHRKKNPPPAFRNGGDFFAHFRDFADITAPSKSFSHYYVVYVNKNATVEETEQPVIKGPKNIIEQLEMLDSSDDPLTAKESKQSKFKRKLEAYQKQDKNKDKSSKSKLYSTTKEVPEPLLALS